MPSVQYYQNTAPFWDWVKAMEDQHNNENANRGNESSDNEGEQQQPSNPWTEGWAGFPFGPFPHRPRGHHHGPPPPHARHHHHHHEGPPPPPPADGESDPEAGPSHERGPSDNDNNNEEPHRAGRGRHGHRGPGGRCDPRMRGGRGGFGGRGGGFGGGRGRGHHFHPYAQMGMGGPFGAFAQMFQDSLFGGEENNNKDKSEDFKPEADVFDTPEAFVVHVSLPGAKKEDVGVNWDAEKSELSIAGVTYRPGDEEFLKTLAMDERKVGPFERKVRLGSRANPAQVDVEGITARLEDGVLTVEVPKLEGDFVDVKKVEIE